VILAKTIKGYTLGAHFQGRNATHQMKKLALQDLKDFRDAIRIPISDGQLEENPYLPPYYHPGPEAPEIRYLLDRRTALGGFVPQRRNTAKVLTLPARDVYKPLKGGSGNQEVATTMATVRVFKELLRETGENAVGKRIVPIIPDEARTFGMDSWFPTLKIYNRNGQLYTAVDAQLMLAYKESPTGQILHEGINEAGSCASFTAVGTSYSTHDEPMIPVYIFYSMFGFQRTGDSFWAAADQMARGFVLGATAGRTTLTGEGLQHADGHSQLLASTNPAVVAYDPAFAYEVAYIVESGLARMFGENPENIYFYITIYNEPYVQPAEPENLDVEHLLRGMYRFRGATEKRSNVAQILASGVSMPDALRAAEMLAERWDVAADVWSVTSWNELHRDGLAVEKELLRHPDRVRTFVAADTAFDLAGMQRGFDRKKQALGDQTVTMMARHEAEGTTDHPEYQAAVTLLMYRHVCRLHPWPESLSWCMQNLGAEVFTRMFGPYFFQCTGTLRDWDRMDALETVGTPVLLVHGEHDYIVPELAARARDRLPNATLAFFPGCSHMPFFEAPQQYLDALLAFWDEAS
jgi:pyruvate dehydrogenase E1 component